MLTTPKAVLSSFQARPILRARAAGENEAVASLDLGRSEATVALTAAGVCLDDGSTIGWSVLERVADSEGDCYRVAADGLQKIQAYSESFSRVYSLRATSGAPTVLLSGVLMHRIKDITPDQDTVRKIATLRPIVGRVLDTATGLGYTAIEALRQGADAVVTIELDPVMQEVARENPWSGQLFSDPRITRLYGDSYDVVRELPDHAYARIVHDPPAFSLAGQLYSAEFYRQLLRLLAPRGRLFHYIGDLESRSGRTVAQGVIRRLQDVGFTRVTRRPEAFGVLASR